MRATLAILLIAAAMMILAVAYAEGQRAGISCSPSYTEPNCVTTTERAER
jgi:hypothetical protein